MQGCVVRSHCLICMRDLFGNSWKACLSCTDRRLSFEYSRCVQYMRVSVDAELVCCFGNFAKFLSSYWSQANSHVFQIIFLSHFFCIQHHIVLCINIELLSMVQQNGHIKVNTRQWYAADLLYQCMEFNPRLYVE